MTMSPWKLKDEELLAKAQTVLREISATKYQKEVLTAVVNRFVWNVSSMDSNNKWVQEVFKENERLLQLLRDRWEAGWQGDSEKVTSCP